MRNLSNSELNVVSGGIEAKYTVNTYYNSQNSDSHAWSGRLFSTSAVIVVASKGEEDDIESILDSYGSSGPVVPFEKTGQGNCYISSHDVHPSYYKSICIKKAGNNTPDL
jgi:hypothetical protein